MNDKLKPCPFCGGEARLVKGVHRIFDEFAYKVECSNQECHIYDLKTKTKFSKKEAIEAWNRRNER